MQVTTELKPPFSYSFIYIIIFTILIILILFLIKNKKRGKIQSNIIIPKHEDLLTIKNKYLSKIQKLIDDYNNKSITSRKAYQSLSSIIRNFIYEATNIKVQNYTLKDISSINMPVLYELVSEYYDPEFAKFSKGDIISSIDRTRKVIEKWN